MMGACHAGQPEVVKVLISAGVDVNKARNEVWF